jgi:integrase
MKNEVPLEVVSEVLGHSDISITMRFYASQTIEDHKRVSLGAEAMMKKIKG